MRTAWLVVAFACTPAAADEPSPPSVRFEHDMMVRFHMHENLDLLRALEKLLVRGRVDEARAFARAIAEAPDEPGLGALARHAALVRDRAASLARARTADEACHREAELAAACAGCHRDAGASPEFRSPGTPPADRPTVEARMARHLWATDRLWEGLVGGADDSWRDGLDVLAATPLREPDVSKDQAAIGRKLQMLADQARARRRTETAQDRTRSYGEILVTCAGCHAAPAAAPR